MRTNLSFDSKANAPVSHDNTCKYLAETYPEQFAAWLLGRPLVLSVLEPAELQAEPIRADSLIFLQASDMAFPNLERYGRNKERTGLEYP